MLKSSVNDKGPSYQMALLFTAMKFGPTYEWKIR